MSDDRVSMQGVVMKSMTTKQWKEASDLCVELPLIEDRLRRCGLYSTAMLVREAVQRIGYEMAEKSPHMMRRKS